MRAVFRIRRFDPETSGEPRWQEYQVEWDKGDVVLHALHGIHEDQDGTLAYRYSCRGAICGSCAMRINGVAVLACKTQIAELDSDKPITIEPLLNMYAIKDLVVEQGPFFASLRSIMPWLDGDAKDAPDALTSAPEKDQFMRSTDCIMCQCCFSDCPKRGEDEGFLGPAACLAAYKHIYHPQEQSAEARVKAIAGPGGVFDCDRHANCVKVCPKDCRPLRAITLLRRRAEKGAAADG